MNFFGAFSNPESKKHSSVPEKLPTRIDKPVESRWSKEKMQMYTLPGETLRAGDVERYVKSNELFDAEFEKEAPAFVEKISKLLRSDTVVVEEQAVQTAFMLIEEMSADKREALYATFTNSFAIALEKKSAYYFVSLIEELPMQHQKELILCALKNPDEIVRWRAADQIKYLPEEERRELHDLYKDDEDMVVKERVRSNPRERVILTDEKTDPRPVLSEYSSRETRKSDEDLRQLAEETPLYDLHEEDFVRASFDKKGSETTLLDTVPGDEHEPLRGRLIIRHINVNAYRTWKKAYEADALWKKFGFEYVPVEPIVSVKFSGKKAPQADVFTRVLGVSAEDWLVSSSGMHKEHIVNSINKIRDGLILMNIQHGHPHTRNFCLYFPKDKKGRPDINKPPRVYLIDFDQAVSSSLK